MNRQTDRTGQDRTNETFQNFSFRNKFDFQPKEKVSLSNRNWTIRKILIRAFIKDLFWPISKNLIIMNYLSMSAILSVIIFSHFIISLEPYEQLKWFSD